MGTNEMEEEKKYRKTEIPEHIKPRLAEVYFKFGMELDFYRKNAGLKMKEVGLRLGWGEARSKSIIPTIIGAKDPVKFATLMEVASLFGKTLEIKWVDIDKAKPVSRYEDIVNGKENEQIRLLDNTASEPQTHKEKDEHRPPD